MTSKSKTKIRKGSRQSNAIVERSAHENKPEKGSPEKPPSELDTFPIVGIGASAGGLEAFTQLLKHLPTDTGMGFVLVQHLDPLDRSLISLLTRATSMPVSEVTNNLRVKTNRVYIIPPNVKMAIEGGALKLSALERQGAPRSIDFFFESLAPPMPPAERFHGRSPGRLHGSKSTSPRRGKRVSIFALAPEIVITGATGSLFEPLINVC